MPTPADEIMSQVSIPALAARLGTDEASVREAVETALPALLAGVSGEAASPTARPQLADAVRRDHDGAVLDADDPFAHVDPAEGDRIVSHLFGDQRGEVEARLQGVAGDGGGLVARVLPMLAPLVMAWLARKVTGGGTGGGGLGDVLGQVLGGGSAGSTGSSDGTGGGLGDILGDVLGGGGSSGGGGGLGDILGDVLGGGGSSGGGGGLGDILGDVLGGGSAGTSTGAQSGGGLGEVLGQLGGRAGGGGGLDDVLGSVFGNAATR